MLFHRNEPKIRQIPNPRCCLSFSTNWHLLLTIPCHATSQILLVDYGLQLSFVLLSSRTVERTRTHRTGFHFVPFIRAISAAHYATRRPRCSLLVVLTLTPRCHCRHLVQGVRSESLTLARSLARMCDFCLGLACVVGSAGQSECQVPSRGVCSRCAAVQARTWVWCVFLR